jgi:hypothetical protein
MPQTSLNRRNFRQSSTYPESLDLTYKEEVAGSIGHRPLKKQRLQDKSTA